MGKWRVKNPEIETSLIFHSPFLSVYCTIKIVSRFTFSLQSSLLLSVYNKVRQITKFLFIKIDLDILPQSVLVQYVSTFSLKFLFFVEGVLFWGFRGRLSRIWYSFSDLRHLYQDITRKCQLFKKIFCAKNVKLN